ncbi:hypothetical protein [Phenylobacterium sp.]|uniref:hypothetical protein n=1 Tax=Phenylobacterium sp. TaxID=1871053 RepID=UPI002FE13F45
MTSATRIAALVAALGAAVALGGAAHAAQDRDVSEVSVSGHLPTQVTVPLAGKDRKAVRHEVRLAAGVVCRNAITNRDLEFTDLNWCSQKSRVRAMRRYDGMVARGVLTAEAPVIVLSAR